MTPLKPRNSVTTRQATPTPTVISTMAHAPAQATPIALGQKSQDRVVCSLTPLRNNRLAKTGATKIENVIAPRSAKATVHAMGRNSRPSTRCSVKIGM